MGQVSSSIRALFAAVTVVAFSARLAAQLIGSAALFFFLPPTLCPLSGSNLAGRSAHKTDWNLISLADVDSEGSLDRMQLVISRSVS